MSNDTPAGFVVSIKGSRYITHMRRLKDIDEPLANFFAQGLLALNEKLGPFLWQSPTTFTYHPQRFDAFFQKLPRDPHQVSPRLAETHTPLA